MKIFEKFNLNKKEEKKEIKAVKLLHTEAIVQLKEIKEISPGRLRLFFREGKKKQDFVLKIASKEEELKPVLKSLTASKYPEAVSAEKRFEDKYKDLEESELIGCSLKVIARDVENKGKITKLIQSFSEVN